MKTNKSSLSAVLLVSAGFCVSQSVQADTAFSLGSSTTTDGWSVDRYAQSSFADAPVAGNNTFASTISSSDSLNNRPAPYQSTFYNTQGYSRSVVGTPGNWSYSGSLYVTSAMLAGTYAPLSTELWAGTGSNSGYYIMGFLSGMNSRSYSATATSGSQIEVFDDTTGLWSYFSTASMSVGWNTFSISYDNSSASVNYSVDGNPVATQGSAITSQDPDVANFTTAYIEDYNFFGNGSAPDTGSYTANWQAAPVPEPTTIVLSGLGGLASLILVRSRRNK